MDNQGFFAQSMLLLDSLGFLVGSTFLFASVVLLAALGGVCSERVGVINIGLEGLMTLGAFVGATTTHFLGDPWVGFFMGGAAGVLLASLHAVACVSLSANQIVSGIAINFLGVGTALFASKRLFASSNTPSLLGNQLPILFADWLRGIPFVQFAFVQSVIFYFALFCVILVWVLFYRTRWGLRMRAVGEDPYTVDSLGLSVYRLRYFGVLASGFFAGLGGASLSLALSSRFTPSLVSGQGFIALAVVVLGRWQPMRILFACLLFGFFSALEIFSKSISWLHLPSALSASLPYLWVILAMTLTGGKPPPKGLGMPYVKGTVGV